MKFVLILIIMTPSGNSLSVDHIYFKNKNTCEVKAQEIVSQLRAGFNMVTYCLNLEEEKSNDHSQ